MCDSASGSSLEEIKIDDTPEKKDVTLSSINESNNASKHRSRKSGSRNNKSRSNSQRMTRSKRDRRKNRERKTSIENRSIDGGSSEKSIAKDEVLSDEPHSCASEMNPPSKFTLRSSSRLIERRKTYSSHSSIADSECTKAKSEPILITLDSDDDDEDDNMSVLSSRPNRTARIRGELLRKLSGASSLGNAKVYDSSSSSDYESSKRKKRAKVKPVKALSAQAPQRRKYIVNTFSSQTKIKLKRHTKPHIAAVYKPLNKQHQRRLKKLRRHFEERKKRRPPSRKSNSSTKQSQNAYSIVRRSLRSTSTELAPDNSVKSLHITPETSHRKKEFEVANTEQVKESIEETVDKEFEKDKEKKKSEKSIDGKKNEKNMEGKKSERNIEGKKNEKIIEGKKYEKNIEGKKNERNIDGKKAEKCIETKKSEKKADVMKAEKEPGLSDCNNDLEVKKTILDFEEKESKLESSENKSEESGDKKSEIVENKDEKGNKDEKENKDDKENKDEESKNDEENSDVKDSKNEKEIMDEKENKDEKGTENAQDKKEMEEKKDQKEVRKKIEIKFKKVMNTTLKKETESKFIAKNEEENDSLSQKHKVSDGSEQVNTNLNSVLNNAGTVTNEKVPENDQNRNLASNRSRSNERLRKLKKRIKTSDKILRKRGRPRLCDNKPIKEIPTINDMIQIPFLQDSTCFLVAPKLPKCRECRLAVNRANRKMENSYCRFMEYRKLCYSKAGIVLNAGFSIPSEATVEDLNKWLPQLDSPPKDLNCNTSKALLEHIGDQFCDLIDQEKEALSLHIGHDKVITWKRIVQGVREMCDVCSTTLFNIHWVCPICGLAVCIDCYQVRKQGITVSEEERPKNCDFYKWLLCSMRQSHEPSKLIMAQIIPGNALFSMRDCLHKARKKWNIPSYCKCNPREIISSDKCISSGICKQLMCFVSKSFSAEQTNMYYCKDADPCNVDSNYDDLDFEVTGSALKWLEGTVISSSSDIRHFNSYEDFASLRGNLLQNLEDEDTTSRSDHEFTSFSLDDIIACVTKPQNSEKENSEKSMIKHFSQRYPQATSGRDPLPIRIYTKLESSLAFSNVPHSWFCNGRLLFLHQADHKDNLALFQEQWKRGQPILVKGVDERLDMDLWHPDAFCRDFGEIRNDLVDCKTGAIIKNLPMKRFWEGFECFGKRMKDDEGEYMLLKLKDWPPGEDFSEMLPRRFQDLMKGLPLPEYTHRVGILNLAGRLPSWFVRPDLGPKMYNAYGSAFYPTKGTTNLHLDVSDAVNVMVYVGIPADGNAQLHIEEALKAIDEGGCDSLMRARVRARGAKPGALWHIYNARDTDKIRELLTKVAIERGEKLEANHDPIHDQSWYLDAGLRKRLYKDYGVEGYAIAQCLGDAVFIPAGAPHQVRNLHSCVKVAEDFVSPENIAHCFKLTQEFRHLSDTHTNHEDKLQIKNIIYHVVRDALAHLLSESPGPQS